MGDTLYVSELYPSGDTLQPLLAVDVVLRLSVCFLCECGKSCFFAAKMPAVVPSRSVDEAIERGPGRDDTAGERSSSIR